MTTHQQAAQPSLHVGTLAQLARLYQDQTGRRYPLAQLRTLVRSGVVPVLRPRDRRTPEAQFDLARCLDVLLARDRWEAGEL